MGSPTDKLLMHKPKDLEFGGVVGACGMIIGLPATVYALNIACNKNSCSLLQWPSLPTLSDYFDYQVIVIFLAWVCIHFVFAILPFGSFCKGQVLRSGRRLSYRCNAFQAFITALIGFGFLVYMGYPVTIVYKKFLAFLTTAVIFSSLLSVYLYISSFNAPVTDLAHGGNTGHMIYDFFIGRELNPRIGTLDLKFVCELRPGLIGWVLIDLCFLVEAHTLYGYIPPAQLLVTVCHTWYVADGLWHEEAILTTMDIVHDGFGFMLAFGDLAWVPFLYCLQARFLLEHPQEWPWWCLVLFLALHIIGFSIFRGANSQKDEFRKDPLNPALQDIETLKTASGRKLMVSGWWGLCRHPNYLGDLIMALSWSLPTGFSHILSYFYPLYFLGLLLHRFERDDKHCQRKYGNDWKTYCKKVPFKIFPYIY